jgi:hypothetical protein
MNTKRSTLEKVSDSLVIGAALLATGVLAGLLFRQGEVNALKDMNRELLRESEKKTWHLGKQFAEYIEKKARAIPRVFFYPMDKKSG